MPEEIKAASTHSPASQGVFHITAPRRGKVPTIAHADHYICHFFSPVNNSCGIYHVRPFECQLYPFLLIREKNIYKCGVHLLCPHVSDVRHTEGWPNYLRHLKDFFARKDVRAFLKRNPDLFGEYPDSETEIEYLFNL